MMRGRRAVPHVGFGHDLDESGACTIQVDEGAAAVWQRRVVERFRRVL